MSQSKILFVTDNSSVADEISSAKAHLNFEVFQISNLLGASAFLSLKAHTIDVICFDADILTKDTRLSTFDIISLIQNFIRAAEYSKTPLLAAYVDQNCQQKDIEQILDTDINGLVPSGKLFGTDDLICAISELLAGHVHLPRKLVDYYLNPQKLVTHLKSTGIQLTRRQSQIMHLISTRGASNKVIARTLKISESTVKLHVGAILKKYGVRNRTQLALCSLGNGRL